MYWSVWHRIHTSRWSGCGCLQISSSLSPWVKTAKHSLKDSTLLLRLRTLGKAHCCLHGRLSLWLHTHAQRNICLVSDQLPSHYLLQELDLSVRVLKMTGVRDDVVQFYSRFVCLSCVELLLSLYSRNFMSTLHYSFSRPCSLVYNRNNHVLFDFHTRKSKIIAFSDEYTPGFMFNFKMPF